MSRLTNTSIFVNKFDDESGSWADTRQFLPGAAAVKPINFVRFQGQALVSIPQKWFVHSPDGFEWGYGGSGPADLALNILGLFVPPPEAWRLHQHFKFEVIARISREEGGALTALDVLRWIQHYWSTETEGDNG